jgi:hypothetical protein
VNDDRLETLLRETFRNHEGLADPDRARALVHISPPPTRRWAVVLATAAAVVVLVGVAAYAVGWDRARDQTLPGGTPAPSPTISDQEPPGPTDADYRAMAAAASAETLAKTPVPRGAVRLDGQPRGWPKDYGTSLGPSDGRLTRTAWWSVPMSTDELASFLTSHEPKGLRHSPGEDVINCGNSFGVCDTTYDPIRQSHPEAYGEPTLLVQFTAAGERTVMRADTFTFARPVRPPESYLTAPVTSVGVDRVVPGSQSFRNVRAPHVEITDPDLIDQLVKAVNGLYGHYAFMASCPFAGDPQLSLSLRFHTASGVIRVHGTRVCWDGLTLTRDGQRVGPDLDPDDIDKVVEAVLRKN